MPGTAAAVPALPGVREVLVRAVAADPARRFANASTLRGALTTAVGETLGPDWRAGGDLDRRVAAAIAQRDQDQLPAAPAAIFAPPPPTVDAPPPPRITEPDPVGPVPGPMQAAPLSVPVPPPQRPRSLPPPEPRLGATRASSRRRWPLVVLLILVVLAGALAGLWLALGRPNPFSSSSAPPANTGPLTVGSDVSVSVQRKVNDATACDVSFSFVASGSLTGQGSLVYHFEQSDGRLTKDQTIPITNQTRFELPHDWRFSGHGLGQRTLTFVIVQPPGAAGPTKVVKAFDTGC